MASLKMHGMSTFQHKHQPILSTFCNLSEMIAIRWAIFITRSNHFRHWKRLNRKLTMRMHLGAVSLECCKW